MHIISVFKPTSHPVPFLMSCTKQEIVRSYVDGSFNTALSAQHQRIDSNASFTRAQSHTQQPRAQTQRCSGRAWTGGRSFTRRHKENGTDVKTSQALSESHTMDIRRNSSQNKRSCRPPSVHSLMDGCRCTMNCASTE